MIDNISHQTMKKEGGYLELILGSMFSGKTSKLQALYNQYQLCSMKVVVINYIEDMRYGTTNLSTHNKQTIPCILADTLYGLTKNPEGAYYNKLEKAEVILINEGQFFPDICEWTKEWVEKKGKRIHICGLDGDFQRKRFGYLLDLIPLCDTVSKLQAICNGCKDGTPGIFTHRISTETDQKVIGVENYTTLCRTCYTKLNS